MNVFFHDTEVSPYIKYHDRYNYDQLGNIMNETDVVITPSIWYETFGYTVLEALSYGVPVIVSDHVGAKDIIPDGAGLEFSNTNELLNILKNVSSESLKEMNKVIINRAKIKRESEMCMEIINCGYQK